MIASVDLLPDRVHRRATLRVRIRQWWVIWLGLSAAQGASIAWTALTYHAEAQSLQTLETAVSPLKAVQEDCSRLKDQLKVLQERNASLMSLQGSADAFSLLGVVAAASRGLEHQDVQVRNMKLLRDVAAGTRPGRNIERVTLDGVGESDLAVARLSAALRKQSVFEAVTLKSLTRGQNTLAGKSEFSLELQIK